MYKIFGVFFVQLGPCFGQISKFWQTNLSLCFIGYLDGLYKIFESGQIIFLLQENMTFF